MTIATEPAESNESRIIKGTPSWTRCERPSQKFIGNTLLPNDKGKPTIFDVYVYGKNAEAIGLRYGHHPRDEHTHAVEYWNRIRTPLAQALGKALRQWINEHGESKQSLSV